MDYQYNQMRIPITREMAEDIEAFRSLDDLIEREMQAGIRNMIWEMEDERANKHLGPRLGPGRQELREANHRRRQDEHFRSLGRPAGPYRR